MNEKQIEFLVSGKVDISTAMIEAGNKAAELIHSADIISAFDGLGGGMKKEDAPAEIAQYFDRDANSSARLTFLAMDAVAESPFGIPTKEMIAAADHVLHPDYDTDDALDRAFEGDARTFVAVMYHAMIRSSLAEYHPEQYEVRTDGDQDDLMPTYKVSTVVVKSKAAALALCTKLVTESAYFTCTPLPEDEYAFSIMADRAGLLGQ